MGLPQELGTIMPGSSNMRRLVIWLSRRVLVSHAKSSGFWGSILSTTEKEKWGRGRHGGEISESHRRQSMA